jgi:hypothetical protein
MRSGRSSNKVGLSRLGSLFFNFHFAQTLLCGAWTFSTKSITSFPHSVSSSAPIIIQTFLSMYFIATGGTCESLSLKTIFPFISDHTLLVVGIRRTAGLCLDSGSQTNRRSVIRSDGGVSIGNAALRIVLHVCGVSVWEGEMCGVAFVSLLGNGCSATTE